MKIPVYISLIVLMLAPAFALEITAPSEEAAIQTVETLISRLSSYDEVEDRAAAREAIGSVFNYNVFGSAALGERWANVPEAQQEAFIAKLKRCIELAAYNRSANFFDRVQKRKASGAVIVDNAAYVVNEQQVTHNGNVIAFTTVYKIQSVDGTPAMTDFFYELKPISGDVAAYVEKVRTSPQWLVPLYRNTQFKSRGVGEILTLMDSFIARYE